MIKKIGWKLFFTYIIIIIVCIIFIGLFAIFPLRNFYIENLSSNLKSNATLITAFLYDDLSRNNVSEIKSKTGIFGEKIHQRVTIIDAKGKVLGDSERDPILMENHADRPEIKTALEGKTGQNIRYSNTLEIDMLYVATPMIKDNRILGVVRISTPLSQINQKINNLGRIIFFSSIIALFIASIISLIVSLRVTRPLREMSRISQEIAKGNFCNKLKIRSNDELGELSYALNEMSKVLENKIKEISDDKNKIETVLTSVIEGIAAIDEKGKIILYNYAFENIINFPREKAIGKFHWEVIRNNTINELIRNALHKNQTLAQEISILFPQEKYFHISVTPLGKKDNILGIVLVLNDITEIKKMEKMRSEFVANVSHELRTPLTSIQGFIETLKDEKTNDPKKEKHFLKIIERQSNRMNHLIEDLLHLSKLESREIKMDFKDIQLNELVHKIILEFKEKIEKKKHKITLNIPPHLPLIRADYENIELVFSNLLSNAIHYTPEKGKISISASEREKDIYIEIADNGIGIPAEHLPRLFERFYRVDRDRSRKFGGTGLGLAIVKHIIKSHNGTVGVESMSGKGSKFFFTLPKNF